MQLLGSLSQSTKKYKEKEREERMDTLQVYAFNTHYEIHHYKRKDIPKLERDFQIWDDITHKNLDKFYYNEKAQILYLPRGYDSVKLETLTGRPVEIIRRANERKKATYTVSPPRNAIQKEAVRFLAGLEEYEGMVGESQLVLNLPTGEGKTYCTIAACSILGYKAMIIVGTDDLRKQWKRNILEYTNLPANAICPISGQETISRLLRMREKRIQNFAFYITTHVTLRNYMTNEGFDKLNPFFEKLGVGIKVIDEAHTEYLNIFRLDYATNVWKTFYLTATFEQSDAREDRMFQRAFQKVFKLTKQSTARKHQICIGATFTTKANAVEKLSVMGRKGIDKYRYITYEMGKGTIFTAYEKLLRMFLVSMQLEGKILVLTPKKESCDRFKEFTETIFPHYATCVHYSGNKVEDFSKYGIIFATEQILGVGSDIHGLRAVINMVPMRSRRNLIQIVGRLREYASDKDTYMVYLADKSIPPAASMYRDWRKLMEPLAKKFIPVELEI